MAKIRIDNTFQARRFLVSCLNKFNNNEMSERQAKTNISFINCFSKLYEMSSIEKRVDNIVNYLKGRDTINGFEDYVEQD
jgi:hypothetical protein